MKRKDITWFQWFWRILIVVGDIYIYIMFLRAEILEEIVRYGILTLFFTMYLGLMIILDRIDKNNINNN